MVLELLCIESQTYEIAPGRLLQCKEGEVYRVYLDERGGFHFEYPDEQDCFSLPFSVSKLADHFISAFDQRSYNKLYRAVTNLRMMTPDGIEICTATEGRIKISYV